MNIDGARGGWTAALLTIGLSLTGCGGEDSEPGRPGSDGRGVAGGPATSVSPDGAPPGPNFTFTVGETYLRNSAAPPSYVAYLETFFGGVLAPLQALEGLLPDTVAVIYDECGTANSFHDAGTGTITLCHELTRYAYDRFPVTPGSPTADAEKQAFAYSAMAFVLYHEIGHALDHQRDLPIAGNIESAIDSIATVISLETKRPKYASAGADLFRDTPVSLEGRHGGGVDRAGDIYCWTIGGDLPTRELYESGDNVFSGFVDFTGRDCVGEYAGQRDTVRAWVPNLARLQGVGGSAGATGAGSFRFGFGEAWLDGEGADPATRDKVAETFTDALSPLNEAVAELASPVSVVYDRCGSAESSWDPATRTITICAELLARHYDHLIGSLDPSDQPDADVALAAVQFVYRAASYLVYHEAGHALHDDGIIPATEDVESAADTLAAVLMVESGRGEAAAFAALLLDQQPPAQADVHGDVGLRAKDLLCWVFGGDATVRVTPEFAEAAAIYVEQGMDCPAEYVDRRDTVRGWLG